MLSWLQWGRCIHSKLPCIQPPLLWLAYRQGCCPQWGWLTDTFAKPNNHTVWNSSRGGAWISYKYCVQSSLYFYKYLITEIAFKENPGGEFRKSFHGYPSGFAQLLHSPSQWVVEPMQIDTHNRNHNITGSEGYKPWFLPKTVSNNMTDKVSGLNPLIECPCSDRITKSSKASTNIIVKGACRYSKIIRQDTS